MTKLTFLFVPILLLAVLSACHKSPTQSQAIVVKDSVSVKKDTVLVAAVKPKDSVAKATVEDIKVDIQNVDFKYLRAKSKISFKSATQSLDDATLNIRIKKDSIIWLSVTYAAFEVARGIITKDSVIFMNKANAEYYAFDFAGLSKAFDFKLSYDLIQSILVGNMPIPKQPNQRFKKEKDYFLLKQEEGKVIVDNYIGEQNRRLKKLMVTDQPTKNTLTLDYEEFTALNNYLFPYSSLLLLDYQSTQDNQKYQTVFKLKHQKIELLETPLTFPFTIPPRYTKK